MRNRKTSPEPRAEIKRHTKSVPPLAAGRPAWWINVDRADRGSCGG
jgi:hypothetical protein